MEAEPRFDFPSLAGECEQRGLRFLLIGRQALVLHGAPVLSFDFDLWMDPDQRAQSLRFLTEAKGYEASAAPGDATPIVTVFAGSGKLDLFFFREVCNRSGETLRFEDAWRDATRFSDPAASDFIVRTPSIEHLILLKRMRAANRKDEEDLKFLLALREAE